MDLPFVAAIDSPVQWVFDRTASPGWTGRAQYLAISLSAADQYADTPAAELREQFLPALAELFPAARDARVTEFFVTRERRATFRQAPGSGALRPKAATARPGLVLAGAWTDTGWPDTMEGAVRSGLAAAAGLRRPCSLPPQRQGYRTVTAVMPEGVALARTWSAPRWKPRSPGSPRTCARSRPTTSAWRTPRVTRSGNGSGKALRPALALLSARAAGAPPERGVHRRGGGRARAQLLPAARRHHGQRHRAQAPADGLDRVRRRRGHPGRGRAARAGPGPAAGGRHPQGRLGGPLPVRGGRCG